MNNNPINIIKMLMTKGNPQQMLKKMVGNNLMINNLIDMAQSGNSKGVEEFARNFYKERGKDCDKEFKEFMSQFKEVSTNFASDV